jgi:hypothetical protein
MSLYQRQGGVWQLGSGTLRDLQRLPNGEWLGASDDGHIYETNAGSVYAGSMIHSLASLHLDGDEGWAAGNGTVLHQLRDGGWMQELPPGGASVEWWETARAGGKIAAVGAGGAVSVFTLDGGWQNAGAQPGTPSFYGVWAPNPNVPIFWVVGSDAHVWSLDATSAPVLNGQTILANQPFGSLFDVWGSAPNDVWAVGDEGAVVHFNGTTWTFVETGAFRKLERVRGRPLPDGGHELFMVGEFGTVLRKRY